VTLVGGELAVAAAARQVADAALKKKEVFFFSRGMHEQAPLICWVEERADLEDRGL
jgi:hypothetical protein